MTFEFEKQLEKIVPKLSWEACTPNCPAVDGAQGYRAQMIVPSNYKVLSVTSFAVTVFKYTKTGCSGHKSHTILLQDIPGLPPSSKTSEAGLLLKILDGSIVYLISHRGMEEAGMLVSSNTDDSTIFRNLKSIVEDGQFPIVDLNLRNAALDVGLLALGIKHSDSKTGQTIGLYGNSYGATLGLQAVKLLPNLFDFAIFTGAPLQQGLQPDSLRGVAENCALDDYCRGRIGGNIHSELLRGIEKILKGEANECIRAFTTAMSRPYLAGKKELFRSEFEKLHDYEKLEKLSALFLYLTREKKSDVSKTPNNIHNAQLIIPFVKATCDCVNPRSYKNEILYSLLPFFGRFDVQVVLAPPDQKEEHRVNGLVNMMINIDQYASDLDGIVYNYPKEIFNPPESRYFYDVYCGDLVQFRPHLGSMRSSSASIPTTPKTKILFGMGRMDMNSAYRAAWDLFNNIGAPEKIWLLLEHRGHQVMWSDCFNMLSQYVVGMRVSIDEEGMKQCINRVNDKEKLDWQFKMEPRWQSYGIL